MRGMHGNGVVLAETIKAAKSVMQAFYLSDSDGTNVLLQEFVKESAGTDVRAFVVGSQVVASMKRQSSGGAGVGHGDVELDRVVVEAVS